MLVVASRCVPARGARRSSRAAAAESDDRLRPADPASAALPPAGSGPVVLFIAPVLRGAGQRSRSSTSQTYLYYIQLKASLPVAGRTGSPYDDDGREDRSATTSTGCGNTNFLDNLSIETSATTRSRTASIGKIVTYNMEERQRVKIVDYVGSKKIETSKIDEKLKDAERRDPPRHVHRSRPRPQGRGHRPRHDEGEGLPGRRGHARDQAESPGGPKLVHLTFNMDEGPKVKIRRDRLRRQQGDQRRHAASAR